MKSSAESGSRGSSPTVLQIVPFRTSRQDGIGDYARVLADGLERHHGIKTVFLGGTPAGVYPAPDDGWPTAYVAARTGAALVAALRQAQAEHPLRGVILHVGGYGYAKRGVPLWLLHGLERWRAGNDSSRWIGIFHELYATGKPWQSSFWLGPAQRHVAREIWKRVDCGITTNTRYLGDLRRWRPDASATLLPVPSSVGEPDCVPGLSTRPNRAMVFGAAGVEGAIYGAHAEAFAAIVDKLGITEILDVGSRRSAPPDRLGRARVEIMGRMPADEVSRQMLECRLGLMSYDTTRLGKSTVFASFAAHGVIPVCIGFPSPPTDGLEAGRHLVVPCLAPLPTSTGELADMQRHLTHWYARHSTSALARTVARLLDGDKHVALGDASGKTTARSGRHALDRTNLAYGSSPTRHTVVRKFRLAARVSIFAQALAA